MAQDSTSTFPVIPKKHWWNLRNKFKKSIPGTVTPNYISSVLKMSEGSAGSNVIPSLRMIGIINDEGKVVQDAARKFRDDQQYAEYCADVLKHIYPPELREAFPDVDSDAAGVSSWFSNSTGVGVSGANRMRAFYLLLCEADPAKEKPSDGTSTKSSSAPKRRAPQAKARGSASKTDMREKRGENEQQAHHPGLHINIQVHISSDATPDQIDQIFESMAKHVYRVEKDAK